MHISLALILDGIGLEIEPPRCAGHGVNPKFTSAELHVAGEAHAPECLRICPLSEALAAESLDRAFFLCVRDREQDERETPETMARITVAARGAELRDLYNRVQRVFNKFAAWILAMERSTARRGGFQELLDLAEPIFHNLITVQDSTFKLVAHTRNIRTTDVVMNRLLTAGYHPEANMELFRRHRRLEQFRTRTEIIVSRDRLTSEHDIVKKTFTAPDGMIHFLVVMDCNCRPASTALVELFEMLVEYVQRSIDLEAAQTGGKGGAKSLVLDLLDGAVASREEAELRSTYCAYPFTGNFRLCLFAFDDEINVPTASLLRSLAEACVRGIAFSRNSHVLLLGAEPPDIRKFHANLLEILNGIDFRCGLSDTFACLWDLPVAREQARIALDMSAKLKPDAALARERLAHCCLFSGIIAHHIVSTACRAAPEVYAALFGKNTLDRLRDYDKRHNTNTLTTLRTYLGCERRATNASAALHMHRNTVLYHIEKIEHLLGISLEDADTRLWLLLAFRADDLDKPR